MSRARKLRDSHGAESCVNPICQQSPQMASTIGYGFMRELEPNVNSGTYWSGPRLAAVSSAQTDAHVIQAEYKSIQDSYSKKKLPGDFLLNDSRSGIKQAQRETTSVWVTCICAWWSVRYPRQRMTFFGQICSLIVWYRYFRIGMRWGARNHCWTRSKMSIYSFAKKRMDTRYSSLRGNWTRVIPIMIS
jgi:hypothetical protein